MTCPTPTTTGVRGSRAMARAAYRFTTRGPPGRIGRLGAHARRRRLGSRRLRPEGDPQGRAGRAGPRGRRPRHLRRRRSRSTTPTSAPPWAAPSSRGSADLGVCVCGTGIGIAMAANKVPGVRAAVVHDVTTAALARRHNHANVICLGARTTGATVAVDALAAFLGRPPRSTGATTGVSRSWRRLERGLVHHASSRRDSMSSYDDRTGRRSRGGRPHRPGARAPADDAAADRLGELHLAGRAGRLRLGADQQVRRGLPGPPLLRRQPDHRRGRGPGPRPGHGPVRGRARQRAAPRRGQRQPRRLPGAARAGRHHPRHAARPRRPPHPRLAGLASSRSSGASSPTA